MNNLLYLLEKEIKQIEKEIKHKKITKIKYNTIRNLKTLVRFMQLCLPYALIGTLLAKSFNSIGLGYPFIIDKEIDTLDIKKTLDSLGNNKVESQYKDFTSPLNIIRYYSNWEKTEEGIYTRNCKTYKIEKITEEEFFEIINKGSLSLNELLGDPIVEKTEKKVKLTEEDQKMQNYYQLVIYDKDENKFIVHNEQTTDNIFITFIYIVILFSSLFSFAQCRKEYLKYNFTDLIEQINEEANQHSEKVLKEKLKVLKNNYERLTR